jgi:cob(I)alamin adenosyltransferase
MIDNSNRDKRNGLLINITGNGKGKTSGALGIAVRALGWGWNVAMVQFIKDDTETGERRFAQNAGMNFEICSIGAGFTWRRNASREEDIACSQRGWGMATEYLQQNKVTDLLILDELNIVLSKNYLPLATTIQQLQQRPPWMHVIITGRNAPEPLIAVSDMVSEINEIKHPFRAGIPAQRGIDF